MLKISIKTVNWIKLSSTRLTLAGAALSMMLIGATHQAKAAECPGLPQTVEQVDVEKYMGRWYEIARLPQIYQPFCTKVTADYSLQDDGKVKVVNRCRVADPTFGLPISVMGEAYPTDQTNSRLKVKFFNGLAVGDYWVLELDQDYQWALVGDPYRLSLYVLSRNPYLDEEIIEKLLLLAQSKHGYDISGVIRTRQ